MCSDEFFLKHALVFPFKVIVEDFVSLFVGVFIAFAIWRLSSERKLHVPEMHGAMCGELHIVQMQMSSASGGR